MTVHVQAHRAAAGCRGRRAAETRRHWTATSDMASARALPVRRVRSGYAHAPGGRIRKRDLGVLSRQSAHLERDIAQMHLQSSAALAARVALFPALTGSLCGLWHPPLSHCCVVYMGLSSNMSMGAAFDGYGM